MKNVLVKGPLYDRMKEEYAPSAKYFDRFMKLLIESSIDSCAFALNPRGVKHLITPALTKHFDLDEKKVREISYAIRDFYESRDMARTIVVTRVPMRPGRGRPPKHAYERDGMEFFATTYSDGASFSEWLLNHAEDKHRKYFSELLRDFSRVHRRRITTE